MRKSVWLYGALAVCLVASACSRSSSSSSKSAAVVDGQQFVVGRSTGDDGSGVRDGCSGATLTATDIGITPTTITIEVMADVGSPLAPGLFQGNLDAINGFAKYVNANGGIACRKLVVRTWDSKLDPTESKNGLIDACANAFAMVGNNALFNPDVSPLTELRRQEREGDGPSRHRRPGQRRQRAVRPDGLRHPGVSEPCPITTRRPALQER